MNRQGLREMIDCAEARSKEGGKIWYLDEIFAAARAYACPACEGTGKEDPYDTDCDYASCPECREYRKIADGGEA